MLTDDVIGGLGADVAHLPRAGAAASSAPAPQGGQQTTVLGNGKGGKNGKPTPSTRKSHGSKFSTLVDHTQISQLDSFLVCLICVDMAKIQHLRKKAEMPAEDSFAAAQWLLPRLLQDVSNAKTYPLKLNHLKHQGALCT